MAGRLVVVSDGFYGSCGKGHVTDELIRETVPDDTVAVNVRVGGPNAGHITYGQNCPPWCRIGDEGPNDVPWGAEPQEDHHDAQGNYLGHPWKLRQIPVGAVASPSCKLVIAAGSEINNETLMEEIRALEAAGYQVLDRLCIDSAATVLTQRHIEQEKHHDLNGRIGSTGKGIGAARADRIWRTAKTWGQYAAEFNESQWTMDRTADYLYQLLNQGATVVIEGTQGYGLGLHTENYPQVTSTDCRAIDFLAQAGLSPWHKEVEEFESWVVLRTRPIRVAGNSGPMKGETTWEEIGLRPEKTTVTRKTRRVGEFDAHLANRAIDANGGHGVVKVALTMVDQVLPSVVGAKRVEDLTKEAVEEMTGFIAMMEDKLSGQRIHWIGTGPDSGIWLTDF